MQSAVHLLKLNFIMKKALDLMKNAMQCTCNKRNVKKKVVSNVVKTNLQILNYIFNLMSIQNEANHPQTPLKFSKRTMHGFSAFPSR